ATPSIQASLDETWCGRRDLNPHALRHGNLNPARLPVPPRPQRAPAVPVPGTPDRTLHTQRITALRRGWAARLIPCDAPLHTEKCKNVRAEFGSMDLPGAIGQMISAARHLAPCGRARLPLAAHREELAALPHAHSFEDAPDVFHHPLHPS